MEKKGKERKKKVATLDGKNPAFITQRELVRDSQLLLGARKPFLFLLEGTHGTSKFKIFSQK